MSRVAKMPVTVPAGVDVTMNEQHISVKGAGGQLSIANNALVKVVRQGDTLTFEPVDETREANAMSGTFFPVISFECCLLCCFPNVQYSIPSYSILCQELLIDKA